MIYKKSHSQKLDMELFKKPTAEYRGTPFWSWNCELEKDELLRQIECMKEMGLGGFHMHPRNGMATKYLSDEFMDLVKACVEKAKAEDMLAWLYDEDRYPSGAAGGYVTKDPKFRERKLLMTVNKIDDVDDKKTAVKNGTTYLLGDYDIVLNNKGELASYKKLADGEEASGSLWHAYIVTSEPSGWYNGQTYVDTLNKEAVEKFIEITHETYKKVVGDEFGKTIPAIFTDEPEFSIKQAFAFAESKKDVTLPWTPDFDETYEKLFGFDIKDRLPELFWELPDGEISTARYYYHDHLCERFTEAFSDTVGAWCRENGIELTGHMMEETTLQRQTAAVGEAMRAYRSFGLPGVDILCNFTEYDTVKQAQSASRQYGKEGVLAELYGVTNWDFDFRGHKFQGDWLAALGITTRVHHLSWVSMKGSAKRDYPASINYQSPWYKEYSYIEDHFARVNTVLTRGKPVVNVGVIHPIESNWLHWGPSENTAAIRNHLDDNFKNIIEWLLFGTIDFDFISESCLPAQCGEIGKVLPVGEMNYETVIVPGCETLRKTTIDILNQFIDKGGRVIFAGDAPKYVDAIPNDEAKKLFDRAESIPFSKYAILSALSGERVIEIKDDTGENPAQFLYQLRIDGEEKYLFISNTQPSPKNAPTKTIIKIKGEYTPTLLNTLEGTEEKIDFEAKDGYTTVYFDFYRQDSLLLRLSPVTTTSYKKETAAQNVLATIDFKNKVSYKREEDNVLVLDIAEYSLDGAEMKGPEELLRIDEAIRADFGWPHACGQDTQPWAIEAEPITHHVTLRYTIDTEEKFASTFLCAEEIEELTLNGKKVNLTPSGYFVDKSIIKYPLPKLKKGKNIIVAKFPFGKRVSLEPLYLIGDFNVRLEGCEKTLTAPTDKIGFGDITAQGLAFYGGNITYSTKINVPVDCDLKVNIAKYVGALTKVSLDGADLGALVFDPYDMIIRDVKAGEHTIEFKLFGNRYNTFGGMHNSGWGFWWGPWHYYSKGNWWSYEYNVKKTGILKSPVIEVLEK